MASIICNILDKEKWKISNLHKNILDKLPSVDLIKARSSKPARKNSLQNCATYTKTPTRYGGRCNSQDIAI